MSPSEETVAIATSSNQLLTCPGLGGDGVGSDGPMVGFWMVLGAFE